MASILKDEPVVSGGVATAIVNAGVSLGVLHAGEHGLIVAGVTAILPLAASLLGRAKVTPLGRDMEKAAAAVDLNPETITAIAQALHDQGAAQVAKEAEQVAVKDVEQIVPTLIAGKHPAAFDPDNK